jgi:hypothetical protein
MSVLGPELKLGLFFGAGAEMGYGLPSGGRFALEVFRRGADAEKDLIREQLKSVAKSDICKFGKADYKAILKSSVEYRRPFILKFLDGFDTQVASVLQALGVSDDDVADRFRRLTGRTYGDVVYGHEVKLNDSFRASTSLFCSQAFSALLEIVRQKKATPKLTECLTAFIKLLVGCYAQQMCSDVNDQVFEKAPDGISIFDDLSGLMQVEISQAGLVALEIVLEDTGIDVDVGTPDQLVFQELARSTLERLIEGCLDYQSLIDENFRFLFKPKAHWSNFTKIATFLHVVRSYLIEQADLAKSAVLSGPGYYHDVQDFRSAGLVPHIVGTSNYTELAEQVIGPVCEFEHLHGNVTEFYDPYANSIVRVAPGTAPSGRILVPLLYTQSGIKPLTSVEMSRRYVTLADEFSEADAVVICGYGFNGDDGHINCLFRTLVEGSGKDVFILDYTGSGRPKPNAHRLYCQLLRLRSTAGNLHIIPVNGDRQTPSGQPWYRAVADQVRKLRSGSARLATVA